MKVKVPPTIPPINEMRMREMCFFIGYQLIVNGFGCKISNNLD